MFGTDYKQYHLHITVYGVWRSQKQKISKVSVKLNWNSQRGWGGGQTKKPSRGRLRIFSGTMHSINSINLTIAGAHDPESPSPILSLGVKLFTYLFIFKTYQSPAVSQEFLHPHFKMPNQNTVRTLMPCYYSLTNHTDHVKMFNDKLEF